LYVFLYVHHGNDETTFLSFGEYYSVRHVKDTWN